MSESGTGDGEANRARSETPTPPPPPAQAGPRAARFASLQIPEYRLLWWGGMFVFLASQTQQIARGWLAYDLTGSNAALGGGVFAFGVTSLVAIPAGGVLADRIGKRSILMFAQSTMTAAALGVAVAISTGAIQYWMLVVAGGVQGLGMSLLGPARLAMTADLVERDSLTNAILLSNASVQMTRVLGPAVGGILIGIAVVGVGGVYYVGATLSALSVVATVKLPAGAPRYRSRLSAFDDLIAGFAYVRGHRELARLLVVSLLIVMLGFPHITFLPGLVEDIYELDAWALGLLTTSGAVGAVIASVALASAKPSRLPSLQVRAAVVFGVSLIAFAVVPQYWLAVVVMVLVGGGSAAFQALNNSLALTIADVEYHGRVQSLIMLSFTGFGLASLPFGKLADIYGIRPIMSLMGSLVLVSMGLGVLWKRRITPAEPPSL
ncbi:MAG: MFS transporter [Acidimicrobiaceae bacterium]|nr:MFS transporter [Acidimicrobiaceae bacterium]